MFRSDIFWLLPALLVAIYEVFFIWNKLPLEQESSTEVKGEYNQYDQLKIGYLINCCYLIFWIQLVFPLFTISSNNALVILLRIVGYFLIIWGTVLAVLALKKLGRNWSGMDQYQIKKGHQLVTTGVYKLVRHPIYSGVLMEIIGFELVANSWFVLPLSIGTFWVFKNHIAKEEKLLAQKFEERLQDYRSKTKTLIPFLY